MAKSEQKTTVLPPSEPMPPTGCVVCGGSAEPFVDVTEHARVHAACAEARPDIIAKVKARA
jgi:hypothetical protein